MSGEVLLRDVAEADLPILFEQQLDPGPPLPFWERGYSPGVLVR